MDLYLKEGCVVLDLLRNSDSEFIQLGTITFRRENNGYKACNEEKCLIDCIKATLTHNGAQVSIKSCYQAAFGMGERFDAVNQKGRERSIEVIEKFCSQGPVTYCPVPFFFTDAGFGLYIDTLRVSTIAFGEEITILLNGTPEELPEIVFFFGKPAEILESFSKLTGKVKLPPQWAFGPWISANRWNTQSEVENQLMLLKKHQFPASVMVLEAWSDECTFYLWNDTAYRENDGSRGFSYDQLNFEGSSFWPGPKGMIDKLHKEGIRLILWQVPMVKKCKDNPSCAQHDNDWDYLIENRLVALNPDGSPYTISKGRWFEDSLIPDFTNPEAVKWWFDKRRYLLDIGVDGFKTDGGEFIRSDNVSFYDGSTGKEMRNGFSKRYLEVYTDFIGDDRVLFSRAGYTGQQSCPIQWAGDQQSTWDEFRSILKAGITAGLSGIPFWSFDIGGFAGPLPSMELYERSTQMAVFTPVMQWHSEPVGGQFSEIMPSAKGINDRSPWNMAAAYGDEKAMDRLRFHYNMRSNLMPAIYNEALKSQKTGLPVMRHLTLEYPDDANTFDIDDTFMMGDLLIAPIVHEGEVRRKVYLPEGRWVDLWNQKVCQGGCWIESEPYENRIPVYMREGGALALNLGESMKLGSPAGTGVAEYKNLCFYLAGSKGESHFADDQGNEIHITWHDDDVSISRLKGSVPVNLLRTLETED